MKECHTCHICLPDEALHCPVDGGRLVASAIPGDTHLDGRYQLECRLGQGGMGVVYKARHVYLKSFHAVKVIIPELVGSDPLLPARFRQEAIAAAAIRHQNVVAVTDYGVLGGTMPFLIMEFVKGRDLQDLLDESERLTTSQALDIMGPIASGVAAAHRQGIVHRDLKPLNIMVADDAPYSEGVKVTDFGLAKIRTGELVASLVAFQTQGLVGSPYYMAPEQWEDRDLDARSDIYSLGIILYQMLTGKVPFRGNSVPAVMRKHLLEPPPVDELRRWHIPPAIINVLRQSLAKNPAERPRDAEALLHSLRQALATSGSNLSRTFAPGSDGDITIIGDFEDSLEQERLLEASQRAEAERLAAEAAFEEARLRAAELRRQAEEAARRQTAAEAQRRAEAERRARLQAEAEARQHAAEEEARRQAEALRQAQAEAARLQADAEARRQAEEKARREAEALRVVQEAASRRAAEEAQRQAVALRQAQAEAARLAREAETRQQAAEEAHRLAQEEATRRAAAEQEVRNAREEAARFMAEQAVRQQAEREAARLRAEAEARRQAEEAQRQARLEAQRRAAEESAQRQALEAHQARAEAARLKAEQEQARAEAARFKAEQEAAAQLQAEAAQRRAVQEAAAQRQAAEAQRQALEAQRRAEQEAARLRVEQQAAQLRAEQQATQLRAEQDARFKAEQEARRRAEQEAARLKAEQEARRQAEQQAMASSGGNVGAMTAANLAASHTIPALGPDTPARPSRSWLLYAGLAVTVLALGSVGLWFALKPKTDPVGGGSVAGPNMKAQKKPPNMALLTGGKFQMGRSDVPANDAAYPAHAVIVPSVYLGLTEVTNAEYAEFLRATGHAAPENAEGAKDYWTNWQGAKPPAGQEQWPVRNVTVADALAYARWRGGRDGVTYRLPTEAEWEYAARNGASATLYPWGNQWRDNGGCLKASLPCAVGRFAEGDTPTGLQDMLGNVWEWTASTATYYAGNANAATLTAADRQTYIVRGGSYRSDPKNGQDLSAASRLWQTGAPKHPTVGFRLAADAP